MVLYETQLPDFYIYTDTDHKKDIQKTAKHQEEYDDGILSQEHAVHRMGEDEYNIGHISLFQGKTAIQTCF